METIRLNAKIRTQTKKAGSREIRRNGDVPAILYGRKRPPMKLAVSEREFAVQVMNVEGSHLVRWDDSIPELAGKLALVKDVQIDPVNGRVLHCDLYEVDENAAIRVRVPLHFLGRAAGVDLGGILQPIVREIQVLCLPTQIPEFIEIDVSSLGIHGVIHLNEIGLPAGVENPSDSVEPVVTVLPPTVEETKAISPGAIVPSDVVTTPGSPAPEKKTASK